MAEDGAAAAKPAKIRKRSLPEDIRVFEEPQIMLVRMGRQVATYYGSIGRLDLKRTRVELTSATIRVTSQNAELAADRLRIDFERGALLAEGGIRLREREVSLTADRATALPSLARLTFGGKVRIRADHRDAAAALLDSGSF